jgi:hypothetical protein
MNRTGRSRSGQRGFALAMSAFALVAMFALMVVAVDIGRLSHTATEVQGIADAAAMAGALAVMKQGAGNARPAALAAAQDNRFDGRGFVDGTNGQLDVEEGNWDPSANSFTSGRSPTNAVRAIATGQDMRYVLAPLIGIAPTTDMTKSAVAAIGAPAIATVTGPLAVCSSVSNGVNPQPPGPCADGDGAVIKTIPDLQQQGAQNSCFSALSPGSSGSSLEQSRLPAQCGGGNLATLSVGDIIALDNGAQASVLQAIHDCVAPPNNVHRYVLPVIDNCSCNGQDLPVVGFVSIRIDDADTQVITTGSNKRITGAKQICDSQLLGGNIQFTDDNDFGEKVARIVQ